MQALFYPLSYAYSQVSDLLLGFVAADDIVDFTDEAGGDVDQALAVPFLPGMDAIVVTDARLVLRASPTRLEIEQYRVTDNGSEGVFLSIADAARLKKIEIRFSYTPPDGAAPTRIVVRAAATKGGLKAGPPLFVTPDFGTPGPMFGRTLGGMDVSDLGNDRHLLTLPSVLGSAWLVQIASANDPTDLTPLAVKPAIQRVVIDALPRNLSVVLAPAAEALTLWQNPGVLLPESGDQEISFAPLAQKHLRASLKTADGAAALAVPLRFHSDSGGAVQIVTTSLVAEYHVHPLESLPQTLMLRGDFTPLPLSAPAGLMPASSALRLTFKMLGQELNAASPEPSVTPPSSGLRVGLEHWVAVASQVAPRAGEAVGSVLDIVSVRLYLAAAAAANVVLEIQSDTAGSPGEKATPPTVVKLKPGHVGWCEFTLAKPLRVVAGNAPIWLVLRTNKGEVHWFADGVASTAGTPGAGSRISTDRGATWGALDPQLSPAADLLTQLFHRVDDPVAAPIVRLQRGAVILQSNLFPNPVRKSPREFAVDGASLPVAVHAALGAQTGQGRQHNKFIMFSRSVIDLVVEALTLSYDPFGATGSGRGG